MKKAFFSLFVAAGMLLSSCGSLTSGDINNAATKTANAATTAANMATQAATIANAATGAVAADAVSNGKTAGAALKTLYASYKSTGKVNLSGTNLLTAASLISACKDLKSYKKGDENYKGFMKGMLEGAIGVIGQNDAENVMSELVNLSGIDTAKLASNATQLTNDANTVVNSLNTIYNVFKK